jgi:beta-glucosidase
MGFEVFTSVVIAICILSMATAASTAAIKSSNWDSKTPFLWGSATASYQVEGAWNEDGRGLTVWDSFSHTAGKTANGETGDVADDNYHRFEEDIQLIKALGLNSYRFSLAWTRLFPEGRGTPNQAGFDHYNRLIDALLAENITPLVTLFHWDTPLALEEEYKSWLSPEIERDFAAYAEACFKAFGDRVKHWITLNEPLTVATQGYDSGVHAPGRCSDRSRCAEGDSATEPYIAAHNMLNSHAAAVEVYRREFQQTQNGVIGITLNSDFGYPLHADSQEDRDAAMR